MAEVVGFKVGSFLEWDAQRCILSLCSVLFSFLAGRE